MGQNRHVMLVYSLLLLLLLLFLFLLFLLPPQPKVPQRAPRVQLPPSHTLSQWDKEFIAKNREDVYELLVVRGEV